MSIKYFIAIYLALFASYSEIVSAMEPENVLEKFGFKEVLPGDQEEESFEVKLEKAASHGCRIVVDHSKIKLSFSHKKKTEVYDNKDLFAAIQTILALDDPYAIMKTKEEAESLVAKLIVSQFPESKLIPIGNGELCHILYRGCNARQLALIIVFGSAGGNAVDYNIRKPTDEEARRQVGELDRLPEFTKNISNASSFSVDAYYIAVKIKQKYLTQGSVSENGLVALPEAPVEIIAIKHGRQTTNI